MQKTWKKYKRVDWLPEWQCEDLNEAFLPEKNNQNTGKKKKNAKINNFRTLETNEVKQTIN